ncbi:MAG: tRNA dihydrouridine synthase DusB [Candidatus Buchananbacteria bacterium CG10_big_fil_rev_8_21_14_0_10_42_9]|uniref:tRNA-dihydrouridine synthase n=1 Tax=Candidatus Buchananbacteria bacterium CG10_big_fil_rev_8_21_14_0_10_42_9 TaxID=1974526 RepID=A0A2H0W2A1_9BACT|nr:MAG: tRNA dihydrouridine synthase DusB [Candidatus Buchananbacteria bacterium CG10_big_fil_rev_8_21_14_0_10_42_9]
MKNFWQELQHKNEPILALAPMAGVTDFAFREVCKSFGADIIYTEFASATALYYAKSDSAIAKTMELMKFSDGERPVNIQIFGSEPKHFNFAAKKITEELKPDGIDINFGCPARKVFTQGGGCALMNQVSLGREIIKATLAGTNLPVSIKIRAGVHDVDAVTFINKVKDLNITGVIIHGRTYAQKFAGEIQYGQIKAIKEMLDIPVIANGGIYTPEDAKIMLDKTGADGIGLARGVNGKPWLFKQVRDYLAGGKYQEPTLEEITSVALKHSQLAFDAKDSRGIVEMRKHLAWYVKGMPNAKEVRHQLMYVQSLAEIESILT